MKKVLLFAAVVAALVSCANKNNTITAVEKAEGWELLFNGKDLTGWRNFNSDTLEGWYVEDGCLVASGEGSDASGYVVYDKIYEDFDFSIDWKLSYGGNSGLIYHVQEGDAFGVPYITGPEYQLIDKEGWEDRNAPAILHDWQSLGADYSMHLADLSNAKVNPAGEWNNSRITFRNGHVKHYLNGALICEFDVWTDEWFALKAEGKWKNDPEYGLADRGFICLQDHGDKAWFRNIKIKNYPKEPVRKPEAVSIFNGKDLTGWIPFGGGKWSVDEEGNLLVENSDDQRYGYLGTRKYYRDFDLTAEFILGDNGNSGIFFHSYMKDDTRVCGWQCEVAPFGNNSAGVYESYGRGWLYKPTDEQQNLLKVNEWNSIRLRVVGDHVQTWLNGEPVTDLHDEAIAAAPGRIMLQVHDSSDLWVRFRNLMVTEL